MLRGALDFIVGGRATIWSAMATVTAPVIWSTAAGTGGPLLYNGSSNRGVTAYILAVSAGITTSSTVAGKLGITGGPTTAPTTTTAIDALQCLNFVTGAPTTPQCTAYRIGTVSAHGIGFMGCYDVDTGAQTVDTLVNGIQHLGGLVAVGPGNFCSVAGSATLTSGVFAITMIWAEVPND